MQIGDKLWCNDGRSHTRPWFESEITGETRQSWILGATYKVNKKTMLENLGDYGHRRWHTPESRAVVIWIRTHKHKIARLVEQCDDMEALLRIAGLVGYEVAGPHDLNQQSKQQEG